MSRNPILCSVILAAAGCALAREDAVDSYVVGGDGTVLQERARLAWQQEASPTTMNQHEGKTYCGGLVLSGGGWRLPDVDEITRLVLIGDTCPTIDRRAFPDTPCEWFWSASVFPDDPEVAWAVDFKSGDTNGFNAVAGRHRVRCVRSAANDTGLDAGAPDASGPDASNPDASNPDAGIPDTRPLDGGALDGGVRDAGSVDAGSPDAGGGTIYTVRGDGTVLDTESGLVWQQAVSPGATAQQDAAPYCGHLSLAGGGWRVPDLSELSRLVKGTTCPTIDTDAFPETPCEWFWSSTPCDGKPWFTWGVDFNAGLRAYGLVNFARVRCVR